MKIKDRIKDVCIGVAISAWVIACIVGALWVFFKIWMGI